MPEVLYGFGYDELVGVFIQPPHGPKIDGALADRTIYLSQGERFGNLTFKELKDADAGCILWNTEKKKGEILKPADPRWETTLAAPTPPAPR